MNAIDRYRQQRGNTKRSKKLIAYWKVIRDTMKREQCSGDEARCLYQRRDRC